MSYAVGEEGRLGKSAGRTTYGSNFGKSTMNESKRARTQSNWAQGQASGNSVLGQTGQNFASGDAKQIYLTANEYEQYAEKKHPHKYGTKMEYFMETRDRKGQILQLELQNRQLRIEFKKVRADHLEKEYRDKIGPKPDDDIHEREVFADKLLNLRGEIGELRDELAKRKRELEGLKLVRREISEAELLDKIAKVEEECIFQRNEAVRLMQKYPGAGEEQDADEEDRLKYRFGNLVLEEYEQLQQELIGTKSKVNFQKTKCENEHKNLQKKLEELRQETRKLENISEDQKTRLDMLREKKKERNQYDNVGFEKIKKEQEEVRAIMTEYDHEAKKHDDEKDASTKAQQIVMSELNKKIEDLKNELEKIERKKNNQETIPQVQVQDTQVQEDEPSKKETNKAVRFVQVEHAGVAINRRLTLKRIKLEDAVELLMAGDENSPPTEVELSVLENNLKKEPFLLNRRDPRLVARYLVEDNREENVEFKPDSRQNRHIVKSIFKTLVGNLVVKSWSELKSMYTTIYNALASAKTPLTTGFNSVDKDRKDTVTVNGLISVIKSATPEVLKLDENLRNFVIINVIERTDGEELKIANLFMMFSPKEFEERYGRANTDKINAINGGNKYESESSEEENKEEEDNMPPPPKLEINEVKTFNDPKTKEKIYSLEEIKAQQHVKGAMGKLMFGGGGNKDGASGKPAGPLSFMIDNKDEPRRKRPEPAKDKLATKPPEPEEKPKIEKTEEVKNPQQPTQEPPKVVQPQAKEENLAKKNQDVPVPPPQVEEEKKKETQKPPRLKDHGFQINFNNTPTYNDQAIIEKQKESERSALIDSQRKTEEVKPAPEEPKKEPPQPIPEAPVEKKKKEPLILDLEDGEDEDMEIDRMLEQNQKSQNKPSGDLNDEF